MNRKFLALLTTGTLLLTSVAAVGCASKRATLLPTAPAASIQEIQTQPETNKTEEKMVVTPVSYTVPEAEPDTFDTLTAVVMKTSKKTVKKAARKTSKKTKKTRKVTKKAVKKTAKKKTSKTSNSIEFSYGNSVYNYKNMVAYVDIKKDNTIKFTIVEMHHNDKEVQYEICWSASGTIDPKTNKATYSNCIKNIVVFTNTGKNTRMHYSGGRGTIKFSGKALRWSDTHDYSGNNVSFTK